MVVRNWETLPLRGQLLEESIITKMLWLRALCTHRFTVRQTVHGGRSPRLIPAFRMCLAH